MFQTVNHAKVLWEQNAKPKGLFGGHLNIKGLKCKSDQMEQLLIISNIDFLGLTETWLTLTSSAAVINKTGYNVYRKDRAHGIRGGALIYVKDSLQCEQIDIPKTTLECVAVKITLSPEMSFFVITIYRPPKTKDVFYDQLSEVLKKFSCKELILMGDFNLNWLDKAEREKNKKSYS